MLDLVNLLAEAPRTARRASSLGLALLRNRVELFSLELREERHRVFSLFLWGGAGLLLGMVGVVLAAFAVIYAFPPAHRWTAAAVCALIFLAGSGVAFLVVRARLNKSEPPFARTLAELHKDQQAL
ncbi:MAG: phage holin family protein [Desulfarculaceae bacterium]|nr:phage holin family protein [Desulfarculaceae bacterium]MCF8074338.1 phage holin family protein [Desulfarculaceae bacterium]MCF8103562.1 phage holin family protein [Desulfarculaceae bacterium]MCF8117329.1 phage holin family protein [Desulfarculaceae bacterium]